MNDQTEILDENQSPFLLDSVPRDVVSGLVVFLVALPLCLGIALASGGLLFSGLVAGIIGGMVVGAISGSKTSVSGPAAGLAAIVAAQIATLGSFEAFLLAVLLAGVMQIGLGLANAGSLSDFVPSSVIKGLLAAIGVILILKQFPHVLGHDADPPGEMSFQQPDHENTFSELAYLIAGDVHQGAIVVGLLSILILVFWDRWKLLKNSIVPGPLVVVLFGVALNFLFQRWGAPWRIDGNHLVQIPVAENPAQLASFLQLPDFSQWANPAIYLGAITIAVVASLETLLNLEAVDRLDHDRRKSPPNRELIAQGVGNIACGLVGGLPVTSVIVRGSVNVEAGSRTQLSTIFHGLLLLVAVVLLPVYMNLIPLSALAAILLVTGFKLAHPKLFLQMWSEGRYQFLPFVITVLAIVFTDLLLGILIGLGVSLLFILNSNLRRPIRRIMESHIDGKVLHVELANQVSFLNRAALGRVFEQAPRGSKLLIDASQSDYIDPDILSLIREFRDQTALAHGVSVSLRGFRSKYELHDEIQFADYTTREMQDRITPEQVLKILMDGNARFESGTQLTRDFGRQVVATSKGQTPLAAVLSCIDSRVPVELVFDLGIGDIFSIRVAGNVPGEHALGSLEFAVAVAGVKLVVVMGHTRCGAVNASVDLYRQGKNAEEATGCQHLNSIVHEIQQSMNELDRSAFTSAVDQGAVDQDRCDQIARTNVMRSLHVLSTQSRAIRNAIAEGRVLAVGAIYDVTTGKVELLTPDALE